jgi:coenzyme F420 hydrogenase subunit beta
VSDAATTGAGTAGEPAERPERAERSERAERPARGGPDKPQWAELYREVVVSGLCTGCSACVVVCPYDVLGYDDSGGIYKPFHVEEDGGATDCTHGQRGCTLCTRACPRFREWEPEIDTFMFGRPREEDEVYGIASQIVLARATDPVVHEDGQDGGLVSALLIHALEHDMVDAALVSYLEGDGRSWKAVPGVARNRDEVLRAAGSRYTYSANPLAYAEATAAGAERLALVGMGCQTSGPGAMSARRAGKVARRFALTIGLLCSKTFDDAIFDEYFLGRYGLAREDIVKMNIKGVFQVWMRDGSYHELPLKEAHAWTRDGCKCCPDFAAEHSDISTGGIGAFADWTLTLVRTEKGAALLDAVVQSGAVELRPIDDDPGAVELLRKLSRVSRRRWPGNSGPDTRTRIPVTIG